MGLLRRLARRALRGSESSRAGSAEPARPKPSQETRQPADGVALASIHCDPQELKERLEAGEDIVMLDVRTPEEVATGTMASAVHIPLDQLEQRWEEVKDANEVVCYCKAGGRSLKAAELLRARGVFNATSLEGGIGAWSAVGGELA